MPQKFTLAHELYGFKRPAISDQVTESVTHVNQRCYTQRTQAAKDPLQSHNSGQCQGDADRVANSVRLMAVGRQFLLIYFSILIICRMKISHSQI